MGKFMPLMKRSDRSIIRLSFHNQEQKMVSTLDVYSLVYNANLHECVFSLNVHCKWHLELVQIIAHKVSRKVIVKSDSKGSFSVTCMRGVRYNGAPVIQRAKEYNLCLPAFLVRWNCIVNVLEICQQIFRFDVFDAYFAVMHCVDPSYEISKCVQLIQRLVVIDRIKNAHCQLFQFDESKKKCV